MSEDVDEDEEVDLDSPFIHVWDEREDLPPYFKIAVGIGVVVGVAADRVLVEPAVEWIASIDSLDALAAIVGGVLDGIVTWLVTPSISPLGVLEILFWIFIIYLALVVIPAIAPRVI